MAKVFYASAKANLSVVGVLSGLTTGTADITLTSQEIADAGILQFATGHASNECYLPAIKGKVLTIVGAAGAAVLLEAVGGTTVTTVAAGKTAIIACVDGTDYIRITADNPAA